MSERENFAIESTYFEHSTRNLEKARRAYQLWRQTYTRDYVPPGNLGVIYDFFGRYEKALLEFRESLRLNQEASLPFANLTSSYPSVNRVEEARATAAEAQSKQLNSPDLRFMLYKLAFLRNDPTGIAQQVVWASGKPGVEDQFLSFVAQTAAYSGRLGKVRELSTRAVASAKLAGEKETSSGYQVDLAPREGLFGKPAEARHGAEAALGLSNGRDAQYGTALALATAGDTSRAQAMGDDLAKRFPEDTNVQFDYLPTIHAQFALGHNQSSKSFEALQPAAHCDLGECGGAYSTALHPVYVRGATYLAGHQGREAAPSSRKSSITLASYRMNSSASVREEDSPGVDKQSIRIVRSGWALRRRLTAFIELDADQQPQSIACDGTVVPWPMNRLYYSAPRFELVQFAKQIRLSTR